MLKHNQEKKLIEKKRLEEESRRHAVEAEKTKRRQEYLTNLLQERLENARKSAKEREKWQKKHEAEIAEKEKESVREKEERRQMLGEDVRFVARLENARRRTSKSSIQPQPHTGAAAPLAGVGDGSTVRRPHVPRRSEEQLRFAAERKVRLDVLLLPILTT